MTSSECSRELSEARRELLDLGFRNPLINFRALRSKGIEIEDELSVEVFNILLQQGKAMSFLHREDDEPGTDLILAQPEETSIPHARHTDLKLQTPYTPAKLQSRLLNTYYAARTTMQETGVNVLFLVLGMLEWYEAPTSEMPRYAPLILVPVELSRASAQSRFQVAYTGEDLGENLSLREKLSSEMGVKLPDFPEASDLDVKAYLNQVQKVIAPFERWKIHQNRMEIGFFFVREVFDVQRPGRRKLARRLQALRSRRYPGLTRRRGVCTVRKRRAASGRCPAG